MNKMILVAFTALCVAAQAQQSSSTLPAPASKSQTTTTSVEAVKPAAAKKWSASFVNELNTNMQGQKDDGRKAAVTSVNVVGVGYKISEKNTVKVNHQFEYNSVPREDQRAEVKETAAAGSRSGKVFDGYMTLDPYIALNTKVGSILGSEPLVLSNRYYATVSEASVEFSNALPAADKRNGMYRLFTEALWNINPKFSVGVSIDPRINLSPDANSMAVSAREYLSLYYNASDAFQVYQTVGILTGIGSLTQGRKTSERGYSETGVNYTLNKYLAFNAYLASLVSLNTGGIDRLHSAENVDYGFLTSVSF